MLFFARIKEFFRKFIVSLKKNPKNIAIFCLIISFLQYTLSLKPISATTALIQGPNMGFSEFITFLLLVLAIVCALGSFPRREKPKFVMLGLMFAMLVLVILCDFNYLNCIIEATTRELNPIEITAERAFITETQGVVTTNIVFVAISALMFILLPVYGRLLKMINTSVVVEENENMGALELEEDVD